MGGIDAELRHHRPRACRSRAIAKHIVNPDRERLGAAHAAVNGGYPVVGGCTFGPTGSDLEADTRVLAFMQQHVTLVPEKDRPMFSPAIVVTMKDSRKHAGEYPYRRMEWNFDQLVVQLQDCLPGYPAGRARFEALVALARDLNGLPSVAAIIAATAPR